MVKIKINGKTQVIEENIDALKLLELKKIKKESVVFILNDNIIKRDELKNHKIKENDEIEILRFVAGG